MNSKLRTEDYKLGRLHGVKEADNKDSEAHLQRTIFQSQRMKIWITRDKHISVRIFAYEFPIEKASRGRCADLLGYDKEKNLYVIELKRGESTEPLAKVVRQVNDYASMIKSIKGNIEKEFRDEFYLKIKFNDVKKIILAPKIYFDKNKPGKGEDYNSDNLYLGYFRDRDLKNHEPKDLISIHLVK